ncbi:hypothetical protein cypCar_00039233 [Cyprinus carpio]|nr:hypothetical protein cypCar_00039233 [Cyprinus carpio]
MLVQVERPCLTEYLEKVFPPSLLISDDYRTENKVLGVHCLHHIVLIVVVLPCLLDLLSVLEKPPVHFDNVLRHILTHMEMEHKLDLRCVYAKNLVLIIESYFDVPVWHVVILKDGYSNHSSPEEAGEGDCGILGGLRCSRGGSQTEYTGCSAKDSTDCLATVTIHSTMERRMGSLAQSLLRFLVDISSESLPTQLKEQLMTQVSHCLLLLDHCSKGKLQTLLRELDSSRVSEPVLKCIQKVTGASL